MSIVIENEEAESLLRALADATGKDEPEILLGLLRRAAAEDLKGEERIAARLRLIDALSRRYRARLSDAPRPHDEVVGYDENGLPA